MLGKCFAQIFGKYLFVTFDKHWHEWYFVTFQGYWTCVVATNQLVLSLILISYWQTHKSSKTSSRYNRHNVAIVIYYIVGIPPDQNKSYLQYHSAFMKPCILKIREFVVLRHLSYSLNIWARVGNQNEIGMLIGFIMWNMCLDINWLSSNITHLVLMSWSWREMCVFDYIIAYFVLRFHLILMGLKSKKSKLK